MITIEEKKRLVELMGWLFYTKSGAIFRKPNGDNGILKYITFFPEKGGEDLTVLLETLSLYQLGILKEKLSPTNLDFRIVQESPMLMGLYFQDDKNAPVIVEAILEVIE